MEPKERRRQYNREYYQRTRDFRLEYASRYYQEHKEARRAYHKKYYYENWEQENRRMKAERDRKKQVRDSIALHYGCRNPQCYWKGPFEPCQLDFHHFDPKDKKGELGQIKGRCMEKYIAEINKCVVLCRCCHSLLHKEGIPITESLKCDVDPATGLPRTPHNIAGNVETPDCPSCRRSYA